MQTNLTKRRYTPIKPPVCRSKPTLPPPPEEPIEPQKTNPDTQKTFDTNNNQPQNKEKTPHTTTGDTKNGQS
jgi:hypothetical protein